MHTDRTLTTADIANLANELRPSCVAAKLQAEARWASAGHTGPIPFDLIVLYELLADHITPDA